MKYNSQTKLCYPFNLLEPSHTARQPISGPQSPNGVHMVYNLDVPRAMYTLSTCAPVNACLCTALEDQEHLNEHNEILNWNTEINMLNFYIKSNCNYQNTTNTNLGSYHKGYPRAAHIIISLDIFRTRIIFLHAYPQVVKYTCVKFHQIRYISCAY